jgi:hypothetical protein
MTAPELPARPFVQTLRAGGTLHRAHDVSRGAIFFGPGAGNPPLYRFDAPGGEYGVCYLGVDEEAAFVEGVLHRAIPRRIISAKMLAARAISVIHILDDIRAVRLYGQYLVGNGATAAVVHGDDYHGLSQPWSKAIHDHPVGVDGILLHGQTRRLGDGAGALRARRTQDRGRCEARALRPRFAHASPAGPLRHRPGAVAVGTTG